MLDLQCSVSEAPVVTSYRLLGPKTHRPSRALQSRESGFVHGSFAVNPWTGDVWSLWGCRKLSTLALRKSQVEIRKCFTREELKQYAQLRRLKPECIQRACNTFNCSSLTGGSAEVLPAEPSPGFHRCPVWIA